MTAAGIGRKSGISAELLDSVRRRLDYPFEPTLRVLEGSTDLSRDELVSQVAAIDKKAVDRLVKDSSKDRARVRMLKTELETIAKKSYSPRLWAKEVSG